MDTKVRLSKLADEVKSAGIAGKSMQAKMSELIEKNDLTGPEIDRIAEMANRDVQLALYKQASDKRFKFDLIDPIPLKQAAKKQAQSAVGRAATANQKVASIVLEHGGDPFAVPYRESKFSLFEQPVSMPVVIQNDMAGIRKTAHDLDRARAELLAVESQGRSEAMKIAGQADKTFDNTVQAAVDMIISGVTLPSLYAAVAASVSGSNGVTEEDRDSADKLMMLIIKAVQERGIPNHRLGFRNRGNVELLDSLSSEDLMDLCKRSTGRIHEQDIPMSLCKIAAYLKATHTEPELNSQGGEVAQPYLDEKYVDNLPGGKPLVINGENEFIIGIKDLMGDQSRMQRCHSANEYIGLKLKQIEHSLRGLKGAEKSAEAKYALATVPPIPPVAAPGGNLVGKAISGIKSGWNALGADTGQRLERAVGAGNFAATVAPMAMSALTPSAPDPERRRRKQANMLSTLGNQIRRDPLTAIGHGVGLAGLGLTVAPMLQEAFSYHPQQAENRMNAMLNEPNAKLLMDQAHKQAWVQAIPAIVSTAAGLASLASSAKSALSPTTPPAAPKPPKPPVAV